MMFLSCFVAIIRLLQPRHIFRVFRVFRGLKSGSPWPTFVFAKTALQPHRAFRVQPLHHPTKDTGKVTVFPPGGESPGAACAGLVSFLSLSGILMLRSCSSSL